MFPIIFSIGPLTLYTFNIFLVFGILAGSFIFWKRAHEEHFEDDEVFDLLIQSVIFSLVISRVGYVLFHLNDFLQDPFAVLLLFSKPGLDEFTAVFGGLIFLGWQVAKKKWDTFEFLDFASLGLSIYFFFVWVGRFFSGAFIGSVTTFPVAVRFPNVFDQRHPTQLYFAGLFLTFYFFLSWLEKRYRFFEWYKAGKYSAQSGFLNGVFVMGYGFVHLVMTPFHTQQMVIMSVRLDIFMHILLMFFGFVILYVRSGKSNFGKKKNTTTIKSTQKTARKLFAVSRLHKQLGQRDE